MAGYNYTPISKCEHVIINQQFLRLAVRVDSIFCQSFTVRNFINTSLSLFNSLKKFNIVKIRVYPIAVLG
jgi:hypothetical protein